MEWIIIGVLSLLVVLLLRRSAGDSLKLSAPRQDRSQPELHGPHTGQMQYPTGGVSVDEFAEPQPGENHKANSAVNEKVLSLLKERKKIEAIKEYRRINPGVDLKDAKEACDRLYADLKRSEGR